MGFLGDSVVKNPLAKQETKETWVQSPSWEDTLEEEMATHSNILAWEIPWTEEPSRLQSTGLPRVRPDWAQHSTTKSSSMNKNSATEDEKDN